MLFEIHSKRRMILGIICISIPIYTWYSLFKTWRKLKHEWTLNKNFNERHNCVVMYNREAGIIGWPGIIKVNSILDLKVCCDPIVQFINTAKRSLDIALMSINSKEIFQALSEAHKCGISIRLLLDLDYNKLSMKDLENMGIPVLFYVCPLPSVCSILHYKYAIKDYSNGQGCVLVSSMNWTSKSFYENYENIIFSTNSTLVEDIHNNFEESWKIVQNLYASNNYCFNLKKITKKLE